MLHAHNTLGMDTPHAAPPDPVSLIDTLDPDAIAARLEELVREQDALRVLLRAARARRRGQQARPPSEKAEVAHAV